MDLERILSAASEDMLRQFEIFSAQYQHRGLRGSAREDVVSNFLVNYLPSNLEIASGEIFDTRGSNTRECDVIILDRLKVPLMFSGNKRLTPIEGVYAVMEVKSSLDSPALRDCLSKCSDIKSMPKTAYYPQEGAVVDTFSIYGQELLHFPTLFSVFAYRGTNPETLIGQVEQFCRDKPPEQTLDSVLCLDGWIMCWWDAEADKYDLVYSPGSQLAVIEGNRNALSFFYLMYYRWLSQAWCRPIRMSDYIQYTNLLQRTYP